MKQSSGTGKGGKSFQDRELASRVRTLTLAECERQLLKKKGKLYEAVLLRLAGSVLPRLNEHTGRDGETLPTPILNVLLSDHSHKTSVPTE